MQSIKKLKIKKVKMPSMSNAKTRQRDVEAKYAIEMGPHMMKAGKYYVGDLMHVLNDKAWEELGETGKVQVQELAALGKIEESEYGSEGKFTLRDGREVVVFHIPDGDGYYTDSKDRKYGVDSGTIGMTLVEGLEEAFDTTDGNSANLVERVKGLGHLIEFKNKFYCGCMNAPDAELGRVARIVLGDEVHIDTEDQEFSPGNFIRQGMAKAKADIAKMNAGVPKSN
jgi:hypothetical protein